MQSIIVLVFSALSMIIYSISVIAFSWCFKLITDSLINKEYSDFKSYILLAILIVLVQAVSNFGYILGKNKYIKEKIVSLKRKLLNSIFNYSIFDYYKKKNSEYQSFLFNDLNIYEQKILSSKFDICEKLILMCFSIIAIACIKVRFIVLVVGLAGLSLGIPFLFGKMAKKYNLILSATNKDAMEKTNEMLGGFSILRAFSCEHIGIDECSKAVTEMESAKMELKSVMACFQSILIFLTTFLTLLIFIWGGQSVITGVITVGELIALIQMLFNFSSPMMGIVTAFGNIKAARPIEDKYKEYISKERIEGKMNFSFNHCIEVNGLSFGYDECEKKLISDINFMFVQGKKYAIVGENGSGKSTLLKLIAGIIDYRKYLGSIRVDGIDRKDLRDSEFWENVAYIPQEPFLFNMTLEDNILMSGDTVDKEVYDKLTRLLAVSKLLDSDYVGKGSDLSGGEKQRIVFLREMVKDSELIIADEPDAALDIETSKKIIDFLANSGKTCIMVTHRLTNYLRSFDEILVMSEGKLVETGTYDNLMEKRGQFYRLCNE